MLSFFLLFSCGSIFSKKKEKDAAAKQKTEKVEDLEPKPGDIKVIDGVEYIYAKNRRYMLTPNEPEYVWIRKDQYSPGIIQSLISAAQTKENVELKSRISKLEEELKKRNIAPQIVYPTQFTAFPTGLGYMPIPFNYPSPKMRRRVIILPIEDQTNYKDENIGELATRRLISRLEGTGAIICIDPATINVSEKVTNQESMKLLNEIYGVQAVVKGVLQDIYSSSSKIEGKETKEISFAVSRISLEVYNTETGVLLKQLSGRNPVSLTKESGDLSSEKAKIKAIDLAIEVIADDLLKAILLIDWHARIASLDKDKVYINAGRLSGLEKGNTLEVYAPGEQIIDEKTKLPLGKIKGKYKGELEVSELFGVDASYAKVKRGSNFSPTDLVYIKD
ncbi:MAG TPA: hypothetical protein PLM71_00085 [Syntrophorhabdaceae bacterium]|nr:hypothetical protein [Syntrophorhabdaceae bacterium]HPU28706.1 hypothetical protein [Syntrophorhabdaceae bacterium]